MEGHQTRSYPDGYASRTPLADNQEAGLLMALQGLEQVRDALLVLGGNIAPVRDLERGKGGQKESDAPKHAA